MTCEEIRLEATAYLAGELGEVERSEIADHIARCADCRAVFEEIETVVGLLSAAPLEHVPKESLEDEIFALVELNGVARLVAGAPIEYDPPIDLERRALAKAGVLQRIIVPSGRWARVAATLAPGLAAAAVFLGVVAINQRSQVDDVEDQFGRLGNLTLNTQLTGLTTPPASGETSMYEHGEGTYFVFVQAESLHAPPGHHYELWMSGEEGRLYVGSFEDADPAVFTISEEPQDYASASIWLEPDDADVMRVQGEAIMQADLEGAVP